MNIFRVLIFSPQADRLERLLLRDPLFHVIDAWQGETDIYTRICKGDADVVVLDENMPGKCLSCHTGRIHFTLFRDCSGAISHRSSNLTW